MLKLLFLLRNSEHISFIYVLMIVRFRNGSNFILKKDSKFYVYDPVTRKWDNWKAAGGEKEAVPVKGANGLYYVRYQS